jgi:hypothetical protein
MHRITKNYKTDMENKKNTITQNSIGEIKPQFDALPHGVIKKDGKIHAVYKAIISFKVTNEGTFDQNNWNEFRGKVNKSRWYYSYANDNLSIHVIDEKAKPATGYSAVFFQNNKPTPDSKSDNNIFFTQDTEETDQISEIFNADTKKKFEVTNLLDKYKEVPVKQMTENQDNTKSFLSSGSAKPFGYDYSKTLIEAEKTGRQIKKEFKKKSGEILDFNAIYSSILDEPVIGEKKYGIIREFYIEMPTLKDKEKQLYSLELIYGVEKIENSAEKCFAFLRHGELYYNGLAEMFFKKEEFKSTSFQLADPYKVHLTQDKKLHPDGIYALVDYYSDAKKTIKDPFNKNYLKGFNVVVQEPLSETFHSLSWHKKKYFKEKKKAGIPFTHHIMETDTSGVMIAKSELMHEKEKKRNNVLFAWRGDNLLVNSSSDGVSENVPNEDPISDQSEEDKFFKKHLFEVDQQLIPGTQLQLLSTENKNLGYYFFLRTVSPLEHYILCRNEISDSEVKKYTLTLEDVAESNDFFKEKVPFSIGNTDELPIQSSTIIGTEIYQNADSEYVDQSNHIVYTYRNENPEIRYIYPSVIKLEDFTYLGYLSPERIKADSLQEYVKRCIKLEDKSENLIHPASSLKKIQYLADARGKYLFFCPSDLHSINALKKSNTTEPFEFSDTYPYFEETYPKEIKVIHDKDKGLNEIKIKSKKTSKLLYEDVPDGIYNFKIYSTDQSQKIAITDINKYNATDLRISVLGDIKKPLALDTKKINLTENLVEKIIVKRNDKDRNYWFYKFGLGEAHPTWKSIKYTEETKVLNLLHKRNEDDSAVNDLYKEYKNANTNVKFELMQNEFPYEIFQRWEGKAKNGETPSLKSSIYPCAISLSLTVTDNLRDLKHIKDFKGNFFELTLNENQRLVVELNKEKRLKIMLNEKHLFPEKVFGESVDLTIEFDESEYCFKLKYLAETEIIGKLINPEISVSDIKIEEAILNHLNLADCKLEFKRSPEFIFISKEKDNFYANKRIQLFASSAFQAYFPKEKNEFKLGNLGTLFHNIIIPNNSIPEKPILKANTFFMQTQSGPKDSQTLITQNALCITLQQDFMKEGPNILGIILSELKNNTAENPSGQNIESTGQLTSEIGEDVTKLAARDLGNMNLRNLLNFYEDQSNKPEILMKYLKVTSDNESPVIKTYKIGEKKYKVLECKPYYNITDKKWQVLLSFDSFDKAETIFMKLLAIKIAPGYGFKGTGTQEDPIIDTTNTCLSELSDPEQLPVYNRKSFSFTKIPAQKRRHRINNLSLNSNDNKTFFLLAFRKPEFSLEFMDKTLDTIDLLTKPDGEVIKKGRFLQFSGNEEIIVSLNDSTQSIAILEFEKHANYKKPKNSDNEPFVKYNPLFDKESDGMRLISISEYKK